MLASMDAYWGVHEYPVTFVYTIGSKVFRNPKMTLFFDPFLVLGNCHCVFGNIYCLNKKLPETLTTARSPNVSIFTPNVSMG